MSSESNRLLDWEHVLSSAALLQQQLPDAVHVGGTAIALHAGHHRSNDADHELLGLRHRFDQVLTQLESVAGWTTARIQKPVLIYGSLDGIETGVRQLIRRQPLETIVVKRNGQPIVIPTQAEILRIKSVLILKRNATRDYLDFVALGSRMSERQVINAMQPFDNLYPQDSGQSAIQQLTAQLANALPFDLDESVPATYRDLIPELQEWSCIQKACADIGHVIFDGLCDLSSIADTQPTSSGFDI